jgi:molybdate transport system substrate-binding protein
MRRARQNLQASTPLGGPRFLRIVATTAGLLGVAACQRDTSTASDAPIRVAAASDLMLAFEELGRRFEQQSGERVTFSFGSTGLLAKQLREGAPFDVFAAANVSFVDEVVDAGACDGQTKVPYARGRIAVWTKSGGATLPASLAELADARFTRIAIANPEHAPYGKAAREALRREGVWAKVEPRLVLGENVRQTLQLAETGNVEAAIVALALVINDRANPWLLVDERLHQPIDQALVVCTHGSNRTGGAAFARFVNAAAGRAVMRRYGFLLPGEKLTLAP